MGASRQRAYDIVAELINPRDLKRTITCSNFFGRYIHPVGSAVITEMAKFRGLRERVALFQPLQLYLSKELQRDSATLVVDGVYAPQSKQEVRFFFCCGCFKNLFEDIFI